MVLSPPVLAGERGSAPAFSHFPPAALAVASLRSRDCRWPFGEPGDDGFAFCAAARLVRSSYCAVHARIARSGATARGRRA